MPQPLQIAFYCERWKALPLGGGIEDQPVREMAEMDTAINVYELYRTYIENCNNKAWWKANVHILKTITKINHLRVTGNWPDEIGERTA